MLYFLGNIFFASGPEDPPKGDCKSRLNKTAHFQKPTYKSWFDPGNWMSTSKDDIRQSFKLPNEPSPVPHLQQVPCRYDKVTFPPNAAYKVTTIILLLGWHILKYKYANKWSI